MKILITGGAGFIGSTLAEELVKTNEVTVVDNFHTGNVDNLRPIINKIHLIHGTSGQTEKFTDAYDVIFHHGMYSSSPMYFDDPTRVGGTITDFIKLLEHARKNNSKVIFASTSSLYYGKKPPHTEDMDIEVTDFYTEARVEMERLAHLYTTLYGLPIIGLRYFSIYGPKERYKTKYANIISQFLWAIKNNKSPVVYGDGTQTRDFIYIVDVIRANMHALTVNKQGVYNIGTGVETSVNQVLEFLTKKVGKKIRPEYIQNKIKNYVQRTQADTSLAEKELGFKSHIPLEQGIERLIKSIY